MINGPKEGASIDATERERPLQSRENPENVRGLLDTGEDADETAAALETFRRACDAGRGAVFLGVARGRASDGVAFPGHYGRAVLVAGVAFRKVASDAALRARLDWLLTARGVREADYLAFDAMRTAAGLTAIAAACIVFYVPREVRGAPGHPRGPPRPTASRPSPISSSPRGLHT